MIRQPEEKNYQTCIQLVYRSGRVSIVVWGALGWNFKSPLVFLTKEEGMRGICSAAYLRQVLEEVVFPYYASLDEDQKGEFIFIEDGSKVHKGKAQLLSLRRELEGLTGLLPLLILTQLKRSGDG